MILSQHENIHNYPTYPSGPVRRKCFQESYCVFSPSKSNTRETTLGRSAGRCWPGSPPENTGNHVGPGCFEDAPPPKRFGRGGGRRSQQRTTVVDWSVPNLPDITDAPLIPTGGGSSVAPPRSQPAGSMGVMFPFQSYCRKHRCLVSSRRR